MIGIGALLAGAGIFLIGFGFFIASFSVLTAAGVQRPRDLLRPLKKPDATERDIPEKMKDWINTESEPWARTELRKRALILFKELKNWEAVYSQLLTTTSETPDPSASMQDF